MESGGLPCLRKDHRDGVEELCDGYGQWLRATWQEEELSSLWRLLAQLFLGKGLRLGTEQG